MGTRSRSRSTWAGSMPRSLARRHLRDRTELEAGRAARFEAEAKYRALVEHIPAVVYLDPVDEDSESMHVSPQVVELLSISQDEWLTNPYAWRHHVHPEDIGRAWDEYQRAYGAHEPLNHEYRMMRGRNGAMGPHAGRRRRARRGVADRQGVMLRHHRAQARGGAGRVPRVPRQADRPAQPGAVRGDAGRAAVARARRRPGGGVAASTSTTSSS